MALRTPARTGLVALGGAAGAAARWVVYEAAPVGAGTFPVTTLAVNVLGAALLGYLVGRVPVRGTRDEAVRLLLGTGVLGGFTTFSTVAVEVWRGPLLLYGLLSVALGVAAAVGGLALGAAARPE
jgi:CrcB protein